MKRVFHASVLVSIAALFALSPAYGSIISGQVNTVGASSVSLTMIDFFSTVFTAHHFNVSVPVSGSFTGLAGSDGTINDLTNNLTNTGPQPVGTPFSDPGWMVFLGSVTPPIPNPNIRFDLTFIHAGDFTSTLCNSATPHPGDTCTPFAFSPFDLSNLGTPGGPVTGVAISFSVNGTAVNTLTNETSPFTGAFSTQIPNTSLQQVVATVSGGGIVTASYSANFVAGVPEPSSIFLGSLGIVMLLAGVGFRKFRGTRA
jgi:hypothetical protein